MVNVKVEGAGGIEKRIARLQRKMGSMEPVFLAAAEAIEKSNKRAWGRGVTLADDTVETKARKGFPPDPLVQSGRLRASLTDSAGEGAVREFLPNEMRFGTSVYYGRFQNFGTVNMPRHKVLKFTPTTRKLIAKVMREHLFGDEL